MLFSGAQLRQIGKLNLHKLNEDRIGEIEGQDHWALLGEGWMAWNLFDF